MNTVKSEIKPKTIICAIKGVYASIFNHRAIAERSYRGFDHETAMMGIAIVPSYKSNASQIIANSVLITRVLNTSTVYGYQMATQKGNNLATNPIPGTISEMSVIAFQVDQEITPTITVQRYAKVDPAQGATHLTTRLLPDDIMFKIQRVGRTIEEEYCRAKKDYYAKCNYVSNSAKKERSLDMEVKIYSDKRILFKQFREFSGK
jgi:phosphoenolpyruvate synthase/pyruvate phosphate dikinase